MLGSDVHNYTLLDNSHTQGVQTVFLISKGNGRIKIRHYRNIYLNRPDPITFLSLGVDTSGRLYDDFIPLMFLDTHREVSNSSRCLFV
jgi:hypothetical protein